MLHRSVNYTVSLNVSPASSINTDEIQIISGHIDNCSYVKGSTFSPVSKITHLQCFTYETRRQRHWHDCWLCSLYSHAFPQLYFIFQMYYLYLMGFMTTYDFLKLKKNIFWIVKHMCNSWHNSNGIKTLFTSLHSLTIQTSFWNKVPEENWKGCDFCSLCFKVPMFPRPFVPTVLFPWVLCSQDPVCPGSYVSWTLE